MSHICFWAKALELGRACLRHRQPGALSRCAAACRRWSLCSGDYCRPELSLPGDVKLLLVLDGFDEAGAARRRIVDWLQGWLERLVRQCRGSQPPSSTPHRDARMHSCQAGMQQRPHHESLQRPHCLSRNFMYTACYGYSFPALNLADKSVLLYGGKHVGPSTKPRIRVRFWSGCRAHSSCCVCVVMTSRPSGTDQPASQCGHANVKVAYIVYFGVMSPLRRSMTITKVICDVGCSL